MVDGTGLENRHTRKGIGGSNPSLSAIPIWLSMSQARHFGFSIYEILLIRFRTQVIF